VILNEPDVAPENVNILRFSLKLYKTPINDTDRRSAVIARLCERGGSIFIYEMGSSPYRCRVLNKGPEHIEIEAVAIQPQRVKPTIKLTGTFLPLLTLSVEKLSSVQVSPLPPSSPELAVITKYLKMHARTPSDSNYRYTDVIGKKVEFGYGKHIEGPIVIEVKNKKFFFVPSYKLDSSTFADILTSVVMHDGDNMKLLGTIGGCIVRFGADLDDDGHPEVITQTCEPNESISYVYYKYYPSVELNVVHGY